MILSDISIRRPVLATVMSLLIILIGLIAFDRLPVRDCDGRPQAMPVVPVEEGRKAIAAGVGGRKRHDATCANAVDGRPNLSILTHRQGARKELDEKAHQRMFVMAALPEKPRVLHRGIEPLRRHFVLDDEVEVR